MNFALIGYDTELASLVDTLVRSTHHGIVAACELDGSELPNSLRGTPIKNDWESLLADQHVDVVILARSGDEEHRLERLKTFVREGIPVIVSHPFSDNSLDLYEIEMIHAEAKAPLLARRPLCGHPAFKRLAELVRSGSSSPIGSINQFVFERFVPGQESDGFTWLARDVGPVLLVCGELLHASAMGSVDEQGRATNLGVQMKDAAGRLIRWTMDCRSQICSIRVELIGDKGTATLLLGPGENSLTMATLDEDKSWREDWDDYDSDRELLESLSGPHIQVPESQSWPAATRDVEIAEAARASLRRGRTIDIAEKAAGEAANFRGIMATLGCGILIFGIAVITAVALAEKLAMEMGWEVAAFVLSYWPWLVLVFLIAFLLLQMFGLAISDTKQDDQRAAVGER